MRAGQGHLEQTANPRLALKPSFLMLSFLVDLNQSWPHVCVSVCLDARCPHLFGFLLSVETKAFGLFFFFSWCEGVLSVTGV